MRRSVLCSAAVFALGTLFGCSSDDTVIPGFTLNSSIAYHQHLADGGIDETYLAINLFDFQAGAVTTCADFQNVLLDGGGYQALAMQIATDGGTAVSTGSYSVVFEPVGSNFVPGIASVALLSSDAGVDELADGESGTVTLTSLGTTIDGTLDTELVYVDGGARVSAKVSFSALDCTSAYGQ